MPLSQKKLYKFGNFRLDPEQRLLHRNGDLIPLAPKVVDTLLVLLENQGRVIGKDELLKTIWPDTFVEENSLAQNISVLRKVLGEGSNGHQHIQTIPKRGYRFVAQPALLESIVVDPGGGEPEGAAIGTPSARWGRRHTLTVATALAIVAPALVWWQHGRPKPITDQDVLVLANIANSTGDSVFDGTLRDALAFELEQSPFLRVLDDEVMRQDLQLMRRSPRERITNEIARDICVREAGKAMLGGSIASLGKSYAIELKAMNCQTGATLARQQGVASDKEHVLTALAQAAQGMRAKLGESLASIQTLSPPELQVTTESLEAFQAFTTGQKLFMQTRFAEAIPFLQQATQLDPSTLELSGHPHGPFLIRV